MSVFNNSFQTGNGRDMAGVWGFSKYAQYDEEDTFVQDFIEIHGEGSWAKAMDIMAEISTMTEEIRETVPELSGASE